jgi:hypothetical protein
MIGGMLNFKVFLFIGCGRSIGECAGKYAFVLIN